MDSSDGFWELSLMLTEGEAKATCCRMKIYEIHTRR